VIFRVKRHPVFERHGDNLKYTLTITFEESVNGHEFTIPHFGGPFSFNTIDLGAAIDPRREYPIKGRGLTKDGTLYIQFDIQYPRDTSVRFNLVPQVL
jgi:DnaJ-class molecular chaperone